MVMYNFLVNIFTNEPHLSLIFCYHSSQKCGLPVNDPWRKSHSNYHRVIWSAMRSGWSTGWESQSKSCLPEVRKCDAAIWKVGIRFFCMTTMHTGSSANYPRCLVPNSSLLLLFARYTLRSDLWHLHPSSSLDHKCPSPWPACSVIK